MAYKAVNVVRVVVWGMTVGAVARHPQRRAYSFQYTPEWIATGIELAPLTMPLQPEPYVFDNLPVMTFKGLPPLLADSLPDDFGGAIVTAALVDAGVPPSKITALDRLAYQGSRGMGALEYEPAHGPKDKTTTAIKIHDLVEASRKAATGTFLNDTETRAAIVNILAVGTSAGGARAKAVIAYNPATKEMRSGQVPAAAGFEQWLIKFDGLGADKELGTTQDYGRIEYAYSRMAKEAGIDMADCDLLRENGRAHFMTRRFDRVAGNKVHIASLCSMGLLDYKLTGAHSYEQYFDVIETLRLGDDAKAEAFRRMVFNVMSANCDDHTKNLSFTLAKGGQWQLSPAYDLTHAFNPQGEWTYQHLMSVNGKFKNIRHDDVMALADRFMVPRPLYLIDQVTAGLARWKKYAQEAGVSPTEIDRVEKDFNLLD
ncbi:MAG: type II toxin-antitoxin system HipA family toxin [Moraxellaceae bacterium]|nr:type II toxin-antitoxin system HipA family toxin [Moraxellaceae bacterium]